MAEFDIIGRATDALRRMMGERVESNTPFNTGSPRWKGQDDEVDIGWDPQGKSHLAYAKMISDKKAAEEAERKAKAAAEREKVNAKAAEKAKAASPTTAQTKTQSQQQVYDGYFLPRKSYNEYFGNNTEAQQRASYVGQGTQLGEGQRWGASGNPFRFRNEYNKYLTDTLKQEADQIRARNGTLTWEQYYVGNEDARGVKHYRSNDTAFGEGDNWGTSGNPYRFANEYNKYLDSKGYKMGQYEPVYTKLGTVNTNFKAPWWS